MGKLVTVHEMIEEGSKRLEECNKANFKIEAELLALNVLGYTKLERILKANNKVAREDEETYWDYISKRCQGIPLQYITREQEFMGFPFYVDSNVLIPRQDTETLIEAIIDKSRETPFRNIIEIGTGSGCISVSLAKFLPYSEITAIDISANALEVARKNAKINQVEDRIKWIQGDLLTNYISDKKIDLIVSNPPYIRTQDCMELDYEVRKHEPNLALDGGRDGLDFYRKITRQSKEHLIENGMLAYEIGHDQSKDVYNIMDRNGFTNIRQIKDLAGRDRVVLGRFKGMLNE
ncbi:MAG: peptide chain release factor N(5)-glutamine methyltransferase [Epulopiscium sp.]|nr:peptide chain release factor N(5)-glutamine methyltransferase [Candidatus Epulonipiscium sp.]